MAGFLSKLWFSDNFHSIRKLATRQALRQVENKRSPQDEGEIDMTEQYDYDAWEITNDWLNRESYKEWQAARPICAYCGEPILEEFAFEFTNGDMVCENCVRDYVDDFCKKYIG